MQQRDVGMCLNLQWFFLSCDTKGQSYSFRRTQHRRILIPRRCVFHNGVLDTYDLQRNPSELIPPPGSQPLLRRKPKALEAKSGDGKVAPTMLDKFIKTGTAEETQEETPPTGIRMDEDGAMYAEPDT